MEKLVDEVDISSKSLASMPEVRNKEEMVTIANVEVEEYSYILEESIWGRRYKAGEETLRKSL